MKNMKAKALFVLMAVLFSLTVPVLSTFADDNSSTEYEYTVTVNYQKKDGSFASRSYTVWATSAREAETKAMDLCKYDIDTKGLGRTASCGAPNATGRKR